MYLTNNTTRRLTGALKESGYSYTSGATHNFYHYPARFSPGIARAVIEEFSKPGDVVLDPFMGGGTTIIEGLLVKRRMIGVDLNSLAHFVSDVRTTPLSRADEAILQRWADQVALAFGAKKLSLPRLPGILNLPTSVEAFIAGARELIDKILPYPRQRRFARCVLLRLGQWALDCRDFAAPRRNRLADKLPLLMSEMLTGLRAFVQGCKESGLHKNEITGNRILIHANADEIGYMQAIRAFGRPQLVFTSPPYPNVHVLYHRWQYRGRKETPAPYWIAGIPDGFYEAHYTGGSRSAAGRRRYFRMIETAFRSVRNVMASDGLVIQLIGFSEPGTQLAEYLQAMSAAGFTGILPGQDKKLRRSVPNRKWYAKIQSRANASTELLLMHKPST